MQPGSRPYAWPCFYRIRGVHAGQGSLVGGHLLPLAPFGHALPMFAVVGAGGQRGGGGMGQAIGDGVRHGGGGAKGRGRGRYRNGGPGDDGNTGSSCVAMAVRAQGQQTPNDTSVWAVGGVMSCPVGARAFRGHGQRERERDHVCVCSFSLGQGPWARQRSTDGQGRCDATLTRTANVYGATAVPVLPPGDRRPGNPHYHAPQPGSAPTPSGVGTDAGQATVVNCRVAWGRCPPPSVLSGPTVGVCPSHSKK